MFEQKVIDANSWRDIPERPGIYFFYLNNITGCKLGLYKNVPHSERELSIAKEALIAKMQFVLSFLRASELHGVMREKSRSRNFRKSYSLSAVEIVANDLLKGIQKIPLNELSGFIELIEKTAFMNKPIYIGIAENQTLKDRYCQHMANFNDETGGTFGGRLRKSGLRWGDISYTFVEMGIKIADHKAILGNLERYLQAVCDPVLSKK